MKTTRALALSTLAISTLALALSAYAALRPAPEVTALRPPQVPLVPDPIGWDPNGPGCLPEPEVFLPSLWPTDDR